MGIYALRRRLGASALVPGEQLFEHKCSAQGSFDTPSALPFAIWVWLSRIFYFSRLAEPDLVLLNPDVGAAWLFCTAEAARSFIEHNAALRDKARAGGAGVYEIRRR